MAGMGSQSAPGRGARILTRTAGAGDWISQVTIEHGPPDVLGRFFLAADAECRRLGVTLSFGTFDELVAANRANRDSWKPMMPILDPAYQDFNDDNAFVFIGRNEQGEIVATQAARLLRLGNGTYHDFAQSLQLNYRDPERMKAPNERCLPTAPSLKAMRGKVLFGGAVWYHPSVRKSGLAALTPRISRAYGYTKWNIDYATAFIVEGPLKGGLGRNAGYPHVEWGITYENTPMGSFQAALCWMTPDFLIDDLRQFLGSAASEVDAAGGERRAQDA